MRISNICLGVLIAVFFSSCQPILGGGENTVNPNWTLTWEENFNELDASRWSKIPRGTADWQNHMSDYDDLYAIKDGKLILRGIVNNVLPSDPSLYLTGGVYTKDKVAFGLGRIEIRAKLNAAEGAWPAFWLLAQGRKYPLGGEIDIMERLNSDNFVYQTVHSSYTIDLGLKYNPKNYGIAAINPNEFNTYSVEKYEDKVAFYVNGKHTFSYSKIQTDKPDQFPYAEGDHYLLLDMQLGGNWVGAVNPNQLPVEIEIDWIKYYKF